MMFSAETIRHSHNRRPSGLRAISGLFSLLRMFHAFCLQCRCRRVLIRHYLQTRISMVELKDRTLPSSTSAVKTRESRCIWNVLMAVGYSETSTSCVVAVSLRSYILIFIKNITRSSTIVDSVGIARFLCKRCAL